MNHKMRLKNPQLLMPMTFPRLNAEKSSILKTAEKFHFTGVKIIWIEIKSKKFFWFVTILHHIELIWWEFEWVIRYLICYELVKYIGRHSNHIRLFHSLVLQYAVSLKPFYYPLLFQSGHYWSLLWSNATFYYHHLKFPTEDCYNVWMCPTEFDCWLCGRPVTLIDTV